MNVFFKEMKANLKTLIIWCIGLLFLIASGIAKYSGLSSAEQPLNDLIAKMPKAIQAFIGGGTFDLSKASGYYGVIFIYLLLMAAIHAVMLGANIIAKEERDKTAEFLMVKPVSRNRIVTQKLFAALANVIILNVATFIISIGMMNKFGQGENINNEIISLMFGMLLIQMLFLSIGSALGAAYKNSKSSSGIAIGILLITYFISIAIDMTNNLDWLRFLTPFKYFDTADIIKGNSLDGFFVAISVILSIILTVITFVSYKKRDLKI